MDFLGGVGGGVTRSDPCFNGGETMKNGRTLSTINFTLWAYFPGVNKCDDLFSDSQ
jgi:hypothetical protein